VINFPEDKPEKYISELPIPNFQILERISGNLDHITQRIEELKKNNSDAWLEIEYTGSEIVSDLKIRLDEAILESNLEIRRVKNKRISESITESNLKQEDLKDLNPSEVFKKCLEINKVTEADKVILEASYKEILNSILEEDTLVS
jgi:exonuclease SbcD